VLFVSSGKRKNRVFLHEKNIVDKFSRVPSTLSHILYVCVQSEREELRKLYFCFANRLHPLSRVCVLSSSFVVFVLQHTYTLINMIQLTSKQRPRNGALVLTLFCVVILAMYTSSCVYATTCDPSNSCPGTDTCCLLTDGSFSCCAYADASMC
jgi:hypothetical protein